MFERKLSVTIFGSGPLATQTLALCNRWAEGALVHLSSDPVDYASALKADLIFICLEPSDSIDLDTQEVVNVVSELEQANDMEFVNHIVVRTRMRPNSAARLGVHVMHSYHPGSLVREARTWLLGTNADSEPERVVDALEQLLESAYQASLLNERPRLDRLSASEAEAVWFTRAALLACSRQYLAETEACLRGRSISAERVFSRVIATAPNNSDTPAPHGDIDEWIDYIARGAVPLLRSMQ